MYITYIDDPLNLVHIYGNEGIGAQYQRIVALISIARRHNLKYIHIPIKIGHNYNNEVEWDEKWEKMFNIKKLTNNDEIDYLTLDNKITKFTHDITLDQLLKDNENKTNILNHYHLPFKIFDNNPDYYLSNIQKELIDAYDEINSTRKLIYDKNKTNIAIHIRVFNKCDNKEYYQNFLEKKSERFYMRDDMYIKYINILKLNYPNADIHIFSQQDKFDIHYSKLRELKDIKLHFDDLDTFDTFHHLCKADVLCLGTSSFSILAGFYNKNTVIYIPYCHPAYLKSWLVYNPFN